MTSNNVDTVNTTASLPVNDLRVVEPRSAGFDVHKMCITAAIRLCDAATGVARDAIKKFSALPDGLRAMTDWLLAHGVTAAAMEGAGVYWKPSFEVLEVAGIRLELFHAPRFPGGRAGGGWVTVRSGRYAAAPAIVVGRSATGLGSSGRLVLIETFVEAKPPRPCHAAGGAVDQMSGSTAPSWASCSGRSCRRGPQPCVAPTRIQPEARQTVPVRPPRTPEVNDRPGSAPAPRRATATAPRGAALRPRAAPGPGHRCPR